MSIASQIKRIQDAKSDIAASITGKGVTVPTGATIDQYSSLIDQIPTGSEPSLQSKTVSPTGKQVTVLPDTGYDGLSSVVVSPVTFVSGPLRPDSELVATYTYDKYAVADEGKTIPTWSTSTVNLVDSTTIADVTIDLSNYYYIICIDMLSIPTYSSRPVAGTQDFWIGSGVYEISRITTTDVYSMQDPTKHRSVVTTSVTDCNTIHRSFYWSTATNFTYVTATYGCSMSRVAPTLSGSTLSLKSPALTIRGNTTYSSSASWDILTDVRNQYVMKMYRTPVGNYNADGWEHSQLIKHAFECANSPTHKLT